MNFFEHQDEARKRTALLVFLFAVALICIVLTTFVAVSWALTLTNTEANLWNVQGLVAVAAGVSLLVASASGFKILSLSGSGAKVAEMMGGRVTSNLADDPREQMLMNVVEEMAIASGVPVPLVYVLEGEEGINAFAAGHGPEDAVVAVTTGALNAFTRDELQGVIAHEFSHILNRDVRLNTRLTGVIFGILVIAITGRMILHGMGRGRIRSSSGKGGSGVAAGVVLGLVLMTVGYVGLFFGKLIKQAVSRQREFLADASAVQFTRNPDGLASALKRIAGWSAGSQLASSNAEEISHFFFADGMKKSWLSSLLSTHPPLSERIKRLDPAFNTDELPAPGYSASDNDTAQIAALTDTAPVDADPQSVVESVGTTEPERFFYDEAIVAEIPDDLRYTIESSLGAVATVYSLILVGDTQNHLLLIDLLRERCEAGVVTEVERVLPLVRQLDHFARLPTVDIAMPALRSMTIEQFDQFSDTLDMLVSSDQHLSLFEYAVRSIVTNRLSTHYGRKVAIKHRISRQTLDDDAATILSALARIGHRKDEEAQQAFDAGLSRLSAVATDRTMRSPDSSTIDRAIARLSQIPYSSRQMVVDACAYCVLSDEEVTVEEAELLRVVIVALGCPLPPFLPRL